MEMTEDSLKYSSTFCPMLSNSRRVRATFQSKLGPLQTKSSARNLAIIKTISNCLIFKRKGLCSEEKKATANCNFFNIKITCNYRINRFRSWMKAQWPQMIILLHSKSESKIRAKAFRRKTNPNCFLILASWQMRRVWISKERVSDWVFANSSLIEWVEKSG